VVADAQSLGDRNESRLLELLTEEPLQALTVADMLAAGIRSPAQTIYGLQLVGHRIDRVEPVTAAGIRTIAYRLRDPQDR
jgi:hypothetical protein